MQIAKTSTPPPFDSAPHQITSCFENISCFGLTHPGFDVVKKTFSGDIAKIQPSFLRLLNTYVRHIFGELVRKRGGWGGGAKREVEGKHTAMRGGGSVRRCFVSAWLVCCCLAGWSLQDRPVASGAAGGAARGITL